MQYTEFASCTPLPLCSECFNSKAMLPYGLQTIHIQKAMEEFIDFLGFINKQLHSRNIPRLECFLMPANFSSIVGEFMNITIPKYCASLVKNKYHNGHPDLIPKGQFPNDAVQHSVEGVEIKGSRHSSGWQGHNPESVWLMVFHFESNTSADFQNQKQPFPFRFAGVYAGRLEKEDWTFSGRSETSRRTITASVNRIGVSKMLENWIYKDSQAYSKESWA